LRHPLSCGAIGMIIAVFCFLMIQNRGGKKFLRAKLQFLSHILKFIEDFFRFSILKHLTLRKNSTLEAS
jgi:hypothetical protein